MISVWIKNPIEGSGVKEYRIVHPVTKKVIGYQLSGNGFMAIPSNDGVIASTLLGLTVAF